MLILLLLRKHKVGIVPVSIGAGLRSAAVQLPVDEGKNGDVHHPKRSPSQKQARWAELRAHEDSMHQVDKTHHVGNHQHAHKAQREHPQRPAWLGPGWYVDGQRSHQK